MNMKPLPLILAIAAYVTVGGCAPRYSVTVAGPKGQSADAELIIQELVVRNLVTREPGNATVLVSFGKSRLDNVDPPEGFFKRLTDTGVSLKPVSQHDPESNPNVLLLAVHLTEWNGETAARVSVIRYRFGVGASDGFTARVEWTKGSWSIAGTTGHWST